MRNNTGLVLLAHGSKNDLWKKPFNQIKEELQKEHLFGKVQLAFFELDTPILEDVVCEFKNQGFTKIKIEPLLLAKGFHIQRDLPNRIKKIKSKFSNLEFIIGNALIDRKIVFDAISTSIINDHLSKKIQWFNPEGKAISCSEKIKVLEDGLDEIVSEVRNFLDDAVLMGCSQKLTKQKIISNLVNLQSEFKEL